MTRFGVSSLALACALAAAGGAHAQSNAADPVGVTSAVNPDARGVRPDGAQNTLLVGNNVIFKERIETGPSGQVQLLFNDQSAISIGPNARVVIDQFVYNPATGTGQMAVTLARGTMRFVGGKISKQSEVAINTPSATIGIRGGVTMPTVNEDGSTRVVHVFGTTTVRTPDGQSATLSRPGFVAEIAPPRAPAPGTAAAAPQPGAAPAAGPQAAAPAGQGGPQPAAPADPGGGGISVRRASEAEISATKNQLEAGPVQQQARAQAAPAAPAQGGGQQQAAGAQPAAPQPGGGAQPPQGGQAAQGGAPGQGGQGGPQPGPVAGGPGPGPGPVGPPPGGAAIEGALGGSGFTGQNSAVAPAQIATVANIGPGPVGPPPVQQISQVAQAGGQLTNSAAQTNAVSTVQQQLQGFSLGYTIFGRARYGRWQTDPGIISTRPDLDKDENARSFSASIVNGRFTGTLSNGQTFGLAVPNDALGRTFVTGPGGTVAPPGQFQGNTFLSGDGRFLYGAYTIGNGDKISVFAGTPVSGQKLRDATTRIVRQYTLAPDPLSGQNIPFVLPMESGGNFASPYVGKYTTVTPAAAGQSGRAMQVNFALDGTGTNQRSLLTVTTGNIFDDGTGATMIGGGGYGYADLTGNQRPGRFSYGASAEIDGAKNAFFGTLSADGAPTYFVLGQNGFDSSNNRVTNDAYRQLVQASGFANNLADQYYRSSTMATYGGTVSGSTAPTTTVMNGYVSGLTERTGGVNGIKQLNNDPTQTVLRLQAGTNSVVALLAFERLGAAESFKLVLGARPTTLTGATTNASGVLTDISNSGFGTFDASGARSALIDLKTWAARDMTNPGAPNDANGNSTFNSVLVTSNQTNSPASVTDNPQQARAAMIPSTAISSSALTTAFPNVTFNDFERMQWGFWTANIVFPDPLVTGGRTDRYALATWVAGVLPTVGSIPATGTATYNGHAIGTVYNNGARYQAAGTYTQTWNFASDTGTATITGFDGLGTITAASLTSANRREFVGSMTNGAGTTGNLNGSFFRGTTDVVKNVGGNFSLTGTNYQAGGIVAGQR